MSIPVKVTYLGHSGFLVETEHCCLLFDCVAQEEKEEEMPYDTGDMPLLPKDKPIIAFVSHKHKDHYCSRIWNLKNQYEEVHYVIGRDLALSAGYRRRLGITDQDLDHVIRAHANRAYEVADLGLKIETFKSTDRGVAYLVMIDGYSIFHAGDLHAWYWEEEGAAYVKHMQEEFEEQMKHMEGKKADIAFLLLDPRLGKRAYDGIDRYLQTLQVKHVFPMHLWKQYDFIERYLEERKDSGLFDPAYFYKISKENQLFIL